MRSKSIALLAAGGLLAVAASPALALGGISQGGSTLGGIYQGGSGNGGSNGGSGGSGYSGGGGGVAAPGPIAGAGLGYLILVGGYFVVRRWRKQATDE